MVSVIIPVYNAQRTIRRCLKSVINQTYPKVEIVVVDDCSSDSSLKIIEDLLANTQHKIVIHKEHNEGIEKARHSGVLASHGELVTFLDNDDYLDNEAIALMVASMTQYDADMVLCKTRSFITLFGLIEINIRPHYKNHETIKIWEKDDIMNNEYMSFFGCGGFSVTVWGKLYKKVFLDKLEMGGLLYTDDLYLNMQVLPKLNRICQIPNVLYNYERQGTTSKYMSLWIDESKRLYKLKIKKNKEMHLEKAFLYSTIELRNCFEAQVESMILHNVDTRENIKKWIAEELMDSTYDVFDWLKQQDNCGKSPISKAIMNKDVDAIYDLARKSVYEWNWKKIARRILVHLN